MINSNSSIDSGSIIIKQDLRIFDTAPANKNSTMINFLFIIKRFN